MQEVKFAGFMESRDERAAEVEKELGVKRYKDEAGLLADVDAVTIVVPTPAHYDVAKKALDAGKHVFIEKPITATGCCGRTIRCRSCRIAVCVASEIHRKRATCNVQPARF